MVIYVSMEGERPLNGDLPTFVPVETILKEDGAPISVQGEKPGSLMMNLETRELFLSTDASSQQFALASVDKSDQQKEDDGGGKDWDCNLCSSPGLKKALQRERLQVLRQNPSYREMERLRQRSMMQLKRQDPNFRALERERQRTRMQLRRQDPSFRAMERERQRRRMRLKRRDPLFREREREQQKSRLMVKRTGDVPKICSATGGDSSSPGSGTGPPMSTSGVPTTTTATISQQSHQQQQGPSKSSNSSNCLAIQQHEIPKREAALYGHLQRIVGYHNLLQARGPHSEEAGSSFKSPYFPGGVEPGTCSALVPRRMGPPQLGAGKGLLSQQQHQSQSQHQQQHQQAMVSRQKGFLEGGVSSCHPLGEVFAASYPMMRDQGSLPGGAQPCSALDAAPLLHAASSPEGGRTSHSAAGGLLTSHDLLLPSVPDCPECMEAQRQRAECSLCLGHVPLVPGRGGRRRSSRQSAERFRCTVCNKEFGMKHHLKEHYKSHGDRNLCCPHCDYRTCYGYALRRHVVIRHDRPAQRQTQGLPALQQQQQQQQQLPALPQLPAPPPSLQQLPAPQQLAVQ